MAHMEKCVKSAVFGLAVHYERREGCELSNKDIDQSRTHLNYNLAATLQPLKPEAFVAKRVSEVKNLNRANVVHMVDWIITLPKNVPASDERKFFEYSFEFVANRYGKENIVCGWVHNDETTPHIHISFVPIISQDDIEKLSCKEIMTRNELKSFHPDLANHLEKQLGYLPEIQNGAPINGSRTVKELKAKEDLSLNKSLSNIHQHIEASDKVLEASKEINFQASGIFEKVKTVSKANEMIDELKYNNRQLASDTKVLVDLVNVQKLEIDGYRRMPLARQLDDEFKRRQVLIGKISDLELEKDKIAFENKKLERQLIRVKEDNNELKEENHIHNEFLNELGINRLFQEYKDLYVQNSSKVDIKLFKNIVERAAEILANTLNFLTRRIIYFEDKEQTKTRKQNNREIR